MSLSPEENACMAVATTDICDAKPELIESGDIRILPSIFQIYGKRQVFSGPITTVKVFEDNKLVIQLVESEGAGRVLVIDGGGSMRRALMGGRLVRTAQEMGWVGVVIYGCIRDIDEVNDCEIGIRALATCPQRPGKKGTGDKNVPVQIAGKLIQDGEWLYADRDGVLISKTQLPSIPSHKSSF